MQGIDGPVGKYGPKGATGPDGATGTQGRRGKMGKRGPEGKRGEVGHVGLVGPQGERGPAADNTPVVALTNQVARITRRVQTVKSVQITERTRIHAMRSKGDRLLRHEAQAREQKLQSTEDFLQEYVNRKVGEIMAGKHQFRPIDLSEAYTADSRQGLFGRRRFKSQSLHFSEYGRVKVFGVPFDIQDPAKSASGNNLLVLKGGNPNMRDPISATRPRKVVISLGEGMHIEMLHILGGVAAWAHPFNKGALALKIKVVYINGDTEVFKTRSGDEFADYSRHEFDVPGSKAVEGVVTDHQVRYFTKALTKDSGRVVRIEVSSADNEVVPVTVAMTAQLRIFDHFDHHDDHHDDHHGHHDDHHDDHHGH